VCLHTVEENDYEAAPADGTPGILPCDRAISNRRFARLGNGGFSSGRKQGGSAPGLWRILNQGKFQVAHEIYVPEFRNDGIHRDADLQQDQAAARWEKALCPELRLMLKWWPQKATWLLSCGRRTAPIPVARAFSRPPGVKVEERGITIWRIVDGKIRNEVDKRKWCGSFVSLLAS
jgi:hypothetical protein